MMVRVRPFLGEDFYRMRTSSLERRPLHRMSSHWTRRRSRRMRAVSTPLPWAGLGTTRTSPPDDITMSVSTPQRASVVPSVMRTRSDGALSGPLVKLTLEATPL